MNASALITNKNLSIEDKMNILARTEVEEPIKYKKAVEITEYVIEKVYMNLANPKNSGTSWIGGLEHATDREVWNATSNAVRLSKGTKDKCAFTFERKDDGKVDVILPIDTPSWRRGDMKSQQDNYERYSTRVARLQKKLREKGLTPNKDVKLM